MNREVINRNDNKSGISTAIDYSRRKKLYTIIINTLALFNTESARQDKKLHTETSNSIHNIPIQIPHSSPNI